ncbi:hypothetical protein R615_09940 [Thalassolituus oleivorans R6-15]|nr:hypothetical protein R615_09940 [Thalassolituus oleivorans R6-15]
MKDYGILFIFTEKMSTKAQILDTKNTGLTLGYLVLK